MKQLFGTLPDGKEAYLYTITSGNLTAVISDFGATLVKLLVPDGNGILADVVLGFDTPQEYAASDTFFGAVVGRNANRMKGARFTLGGREYSLRANDNGCNNLHSGPDFFKDRLWLVDEVDESSIRLRLTSPDGDQGFPGKATICVTYRLEQGNCLRISYDAVSDKDTVFNFTNHSYFNLAGHNHPEKAMEQVLTMPARRYTFSDAQCVPTGELRSVENTPMDFRTPQVIGSRLDQQFDSLLLQGGYDHNFEVFTAPCAILSDPSSGRSMAVTTDCPGVQLYTANFLGDVAGKDGARYCYRGGVCLETQFYPDSVNHPEWRQPFTPAREHYHSETSYRFG